MGLLQTGSRILKGRNNSSLLLDIYSAPIAYSLEYVSTSYIGNSVINVRRSSDSLTQDFTPLEIANGTLASFCGVSNGFITSWYNQGSLGVSGDATQPTLTNQPKIYDGTTGVVLDHNGKPSIYFNDGLWLEYDINGGESELEPRMFFMVVDPLSRISVNPSLMDSAPAQKQRIYGIRSGDTELRMHSGSTRFSIDISSENWYTKNQLFYCIFNAPNVNEMAVNGDVATTFIGGSNASVTAMAIGRPVDQSYEMRVNELIMYKTADNSNRAAIEANINSRYNIF